MSMSIIPWHDSTSVLSSSPGECQAVYLFHTPKGPLFNSKLKKRILKYYAKQWRSQRGFVEISWPKPLSRNYFILMRIFRNKGEGFPTSSIRTPDPKILNPPLMQQNTVKPATTNFLLTVAVHLDPHRAQQSQRCYLILYVCVCVCVCVCLCVCVCVCVCVFWLALIILYTQLQKKRECFKIGIVLQKRLKLKPKCPRCDDNAPDLYLLKKEIRMLIDFRLLY